MKKRSALKRIFYDALLAALILTAAGSAAAIAAKWAGRQKQDAQMESLFALLQEQEGAVQKSRPGGGESSAGAAAGEPSPPRAKEETEDPAAALERRLAGYAALRGQNPDMAGWVRIEGTRVDYPVMQSVDRPDYYLTHGFDKKKSSYGVPYLAESCDLLGDCRNLVIYGHHMKDGSMFAGLMKYADRTYRDSHPLIRFDTMTESLDYRIIGVVRETALKEGASLFAAAEAGNEEQFCSFVRKVKEKSLYDTGESAVWGDRLLTLITCEYSRREGRLLVVAKRVG